MTELLSDRKKLASVKGVFYESFSEKKIEKNPKYTLEFLDIIIEEIKSKTGDTK